MTVRLGHHIDELLKAERFDVVIIGSGYGGGVVAARLAARGTQSICVLERGREFQRGDFPDREQTVLHETQVSKGSVRHGSRLGLFDLRAGDDLSVLVGCGLGGTSLINANVMIRPSRRVLELDSWPLAIRSNPAGLDPYFDRAWTMLRPSQSPHERPKLGVLRASAAETGKPFRKVEVNVSFDATDTQPACVECGNCVTGCNYGAKNTVCETYLDAAWRAGAKIFTQCAVAWIEPCGDEWTVHYHYIVDDNVIEEHSIRAGRVVLAAGAIGSTELLLRSHERGLAVSERLGTRFSGNGDSIAVGYGIPDEVNAIGFGRFRRRRRPVGPTITGIVDLRSEDPATPLEHSIIIEEGAFPGGLALVLRHGLQLVALGAAVPPLGWLRTFWWEILNKLGIGSTDAVLDHTQIYLVIGHDGAAGTLRMGEAGRAEVHWPGAGALDVFERASTEVSALTRAVGGAHVPSPLWSHFDRVITVHPLGGCPMGDDATTGVVDDRGAVFDGKGGTHRGLFVADGAIIPTSVGVNPLWTISALCERIADLMTFEQDEERVR